MLAFLRSRAAALRIASRRRALLAMSALAAIAAAAFACATTDSAPAITPVTGIVVRADALVGELGCGRADDQVFKYVAVVSYAGDAGTVGPQVASGSYDCFADAPFVNLASDDFVVDVFAYNESTYAREGQAIDGAIKGATGTSAKLAELGATWTTRCAAKQQAQIEVLAVCDPLARGPAAPPTAIVLPTDSIGPGGNAGDGGTAACGSDYTRVAASFLDDAGADAGSFAVTCPDPIRLEVPPARYTIDVNLTGGLVNRGTTCHAEPRLGKTVDAGCDPVVVR